MTEEGIKLLKEALLLVNELPRRRYSGSVYKDTYELASEISKFLRKTEKDDTRKS